MQMQLVTTPAQQQQFLQMAVDLYKNDPNYIRPLDKDIEAVFDTEKNKFFKRGECSRWLLLNDQQQPIGRIAAFVNKQYKQSQPTGGIGFFECINSQEAANFMFNHCKQWLEERGMEAMDGPINFGERDKWWGLLIDGFYQPLYCMTYNPPYYQQLMENYGFKLYFNQICYSMSADATLGAKYIERHALIAQDPAFRISCIKKSELERYAADFTYVYNKAWAGHGGGKTIEEKAVQIMFKTMKPVMVEHLICFAYHNEEPIAMWVSLPDLNQYFKHLNGKFGLVQKLQFLYHKTFGKCNRFVGLVFGVIPAFQGKGVDAYLIVELAKIIQAKKKYDIYEMQWIGDFNPKMINIAENLGTTRSRTLRTYRFLFNRDLVVERHPMLA
jgi:hypothetical protein